MKNFIFYVIVIIWLVVSCSEKKQNLFNIVKEWQNKSIVFPEDLELKNFDQDSLYLYSHTKYRIISYIDSSGCTECKLKLPSWRRLKFITDSLNINVKFIFISATKDPQDLAILQIKNNFSMPYFYDRNERMKKVNKLPDNIELQTFLLDSTNKVLLIGNPVFNKRIQQLYLNEMR